MDILHISAECYPAAKAGGLGDVVGALPKYLPELGLKTGVVIPKYATNWLNSRSFSPIYSGVVQLHQETVAFSVMRESDDSLGFPFFVVDIPGKFDRPGIYLQADGEPYPDEVERALCFQMAVLDWLNESAGLPRVLHCHDHHTGLIPFLIRFGIAYRALAHLPTIFTIHNGEYHGNFGYDRMYLLPPFEWEARGLLDWNGMINPLACAIKCAWRVTTVSPSYLQELMTNSSGLESLIQHEQHKCVGIINGIDNDVWNPRTDQYIAREWEEDLEVARFKSSNKRVIGQHFRLEMNRPLFTFIGRLVREKGADLLPDLIRQVLYRGTPAIFAVLGTGEADLHEAFQRLKQQFPNRFDVVLAYNEALAHQLYAGSDFLLMPSRVEPCGLNQLYAMRYATVPVVRAVGGLRDTVPDIGSPGDIGRGIQFTHFTLEDAGGAIDRAVDLYEQTEALQALRQKISELDFGWNTSAAAYARIYRELMSV